MVGLRPLLFLSVLVLFSVSGAQANALKAEITEDIDKGNSRVDAEQDPFTTITLTDQPGVTRTTLFSSCLGSVRLFDAIFASLEVDSGEEYIRYVPDSTQLQNPLAWEELSGAFSTIFDCAQAASDGDWPVFKYDGAECKVAPSGYDLNNVPECGGEESDAVFILSTAVFECLTPRFFLGYTIDDDAICGFVSEDLMTYPEAQMFCNAIFPNNELSLYFNYYRPLTVGDMIGKFTSLGYTNTNLWVLAEESVNVDIGCHVGNFSDEDWDGGSEPFCDKAFAGAAYMDSSLAFKLTPQPKTVKAGALCATTRTMR